MVRIAVLVGLLLVPALPAVASDLFVNNATGDDHNDAMSAVSQGGRSGPARSLTKALYVAERGDRIVIAKTSQPYRENVTLAGGRHNGVVIEGNGATLDGSMPVPIDQWHSEGDGVFRFDPRYKHFNLLFIGDNPVQRAAVDPLALRRPQLKPLEFGVHRGSIFFRSEGNQVAAVVPALLHRPARRNYALQRPGCRRQGFGDPRLSPGRCQRPRRCPALCPRRLDMPPQRPQRDFSRRIVPRRNHGLPGERQRRDAAPHGGALRGECRGQRIWRRRGFRVPTGWRAPLD